MRHHGSGFGPAHGLRWLAEALGSPGHAPGDAHLPPALADLLGLVSLDGRLDDPQVHWAGSLMALPAVTQMVTYLSAGAPVTDTYTGMRLWDLIADAGPQTDPAARNDSLAHYVIATGADGYRAVFSFGEIDPRFGGDQVMVAYDDAAGQLGPDGSGGFARMVVPGDAAGGRYVSNLVGIEVVDIDHPPAAAMDHSWC